MANLLSKVKVNGVIYDLKDATVRTQLAEEIAKLKAAAYKDVAADINGAGLIDAATVKSYVDAQVGSINQFAYEVVSALPTPSADTMYKIYLVADTAGKAPDFYEEFITIEKDGAYSFEKIGDTNIGLEGYVPTSRTIAGLALSADITADALKTALGLKALAYKDSASGEIEVVTGLTGAAYTPAGEVAVTLTQTSTAIESAGKFTPVGNVSGTVKTDGSISVTASHTATAATLTKGDYTPAGDVSVALSGGTFNQITGVGSQASFKEGAFTAATLGHSEDTFAKAGVVAAIDESDAEMLVFTAAATGTASNITSFDGGSKAADQFTANSLPTMAEHTVGVQSAGFTGTKAVGALVTGVSYDKADIDTATFTGATVDINATFAGTEGDVAVAGNYDKASVKTATFSGEAATIAPTLTKETKTVTVE